MKQLTDAERLDIAMGLLDDRQVSEYDKICRKRELGCPDGRCGACNQDECKLIRKD